MVKTKIRMIIFSAAEDGEALYSQQKQDWGLTVAQIMRLLLQNSELNWMLNLGQQKQTWKKPHAAQSQTPEDLCLR